MPAQKRGGESDSGGDQRSGDGLLGSDPRRGHRQAGMAADRPRSGALTRAGRLINSIALVMGRNSIRRKSRIILLASLSIAVAVWSGYRAERRIGDAAGAPAINVKKVVKRLVTSAAERAGTDRLEELRQGIGRKVPSRREEDALWSAIRGFSVDEVEVALESLPKEMNREVNIRIATMLYYRWAQLDPQAAAAAAEGDTNYYFGAVIAAWSRSDPMATIRWGRNSGSKNIRSHIGNFTAWKWVAEDPFKAVSRARAEFPEAVPAVLRQLVGKLPDSPESRTQILKILADEIPEEERLWYFSSYAFRSGVLDSSRVDEIATDMSAAGWSESSIREFHEKFQRTVPAKGIPPILERASPEVGREDRESVYQNWVVNRPDDAIQWAESRGEADLISHSVKELADLVLASAWSPGRETHWPVPNSVRRQFTAWQRMDAPAAAAWLTTLPTDFRNHFTPTIPNDDATR